MKTYLAPHAHHYYKAHGNRGQRCPHADFDSAVTQTEMELELRFRLSEYNTQKSVPFVTALFFGSSCGNFK